MQECQNRNIQVRLNVEMIAETGLGECSTFVDLKTSSRPNLLRSFVAEAHVFMTGIAPATSIMSRLIELATILEDNVGLDTARARIAQSQITKLTLPVITN